MSFPHPTRADHEKFCRAEGWEQVRSARGRTGSHHLTFELWLPAGRVLRTRVSHPPDRTGYGPALWAHILRDQLEVSAEQFWACVHDGTTPGRTGTGGPPADALPADVVHLLLSRVRLAEAEVAAMTRAQAIQRLATFWAGQG